MYYNNRYYCLALPDLAELCLVRQLDKSGRAREVAEQALPRSTLGRALLTVRSEDQVDAPLDEERLKVRLHLLRDPTARQPTAHVYLPVVRHCHPRSLDAVLGC